MTEWSRIDRLGVFRTVILSLVLLRVLWLLSLPLLFGLNLELLGVARDFSTLPTGATLLGLAILAIHSLWRGPSRWATAGLVLGSILLDYQTVFIQDGGNSWIRLSLIHLLFLSHGREARGPIAFGLKVQFLMIYFVSLTSKLLTPQWRDGSAITLIMDSPLFGAGPFGPPPEWNLALAWGAMGIQALLVVGLACRRGRVAALVGCAFHGGVMVTLGISFLSLSLMSGFLLFLPSSADSRYDGSCA